VTEIRFIQHDKREYVVKAADGDSLMRAAQDNHVPGIEGECGGHLTCATCHVYIPEDWYDLLEPPNADEQAMLEMAIDQQPNSRLSCQIFASSAVDGLTVHVPQNQH